MLLFKTENNKTVTYALPFQTTYAQAYSNDNNLQDFHIITCMQQQQ